MTYNRFFLWCAFIIFNVLLGILFVTQPWYVFLPLFISLFLGIIFCIKINWGAYFLILLVPVISNYIGFYVELERMRLVYKSSTLPLFSFFLFASLLGFGMHKASKMRKSPTFKNPLTLYVFGLICYGMLSLLWSPNIKYSLMPLYLLIVNGAMFFFIAKIIDTEEFHRKLMWCWVFSGILTAALTVISIPLHPQIVMSKNLMGAVDFLFRYAPKIDWRGYAMGHPNPTSLSLNLASSIAIGILIIEKGLGKRLFLLAALAFMMFANFLTMSKGGIGAFLVMVFFIITFSSVLRKRFARNIIVLCLAFVLLFLLSLKYAEEQQVQETPRLLNIVKKQGDVVSMGTRFKMWGSGLKEMEKRTQYLTGLSVGGFKHYTSHMHSHNIYLSFFFDFGLVGIAFVTAVVIIIIKLIKGVGKAVYTQQTYFQTIALAILGGILAIAVQGLVDHSYERHVIWLFVGLFVATMQLTKAELNPAVDESTSYL